ncbi:hypothetical protein [Neisseria weixii]|uniref:hypothetical protein n=1 Tax=Neisseria weixii TaxID=1853276 RepID=UPI0035A16472
MYRNVDEALRHAYKLWGVRIEPQNNTAQVMDWIEHKGVRGASSGLTQHEWHANSSMIIKQVERILNRYELAAVELHYTGGLKADGIIDLTAYIERENKGVNLLICDALLAHIFCGVKQEAVQDKYDLNRQCVWRQKKKVNAIVNALLNSAWAKLEIEFEQRGLISPTFCTEAV